MGWGAWRPQNTARGGERPERHRGASGKNTHRPLPFPPPGRLLRPPRVRHLPRHRRRPLPLHPLVGRRRRVRVLRRVGAGRVPPLRWWGAGGAPGEAGARGADAVAVRAAVSAWERCEGLVRGCRFFVCPSPSSVTRTVPPHPPSPPVSCFPLYHHENVFIGRCPSLQLFCFLALCVSPSRLSFPILLCFLKPFPPPKTPPPLTAAPRERERVCCDTRALALCVKNTPLCV